MDKDGNVQDVSVVSFILYCSTCSAYDCADIQCYKTVVVMEGC
jgi:hypothetical protein